MERLDLDMYLMAFRHGAFFRPSWSYPSFDRLILRIARRTPVREPPALQSVNYSRTGAAYPFITAAKGSYKIKAAQGRISSVFS